MNVAEHPSNNNSLIRLPEVRAIVSLSSSTIYEMVARGHFPAQVKIGPRASAWVESEVLAWVESRIAMRETDGKISHE